MQISVQVLRFDSLLQTDQSARSIPARTSQLPIGANDMVNRRVLLTLIPLAALSACMEAKPIVDKSVSRQLTITDVVIDTSALPLRSGGIVRTGRDFALTPKQLQRDLDANITRVIKAREMNGPTKAILKVAVTKVRLTSPGQALAVGGFSYIEGLVSIRSLKGELLLEPTTVAGHSTDFRPGGLVGAIVTPEADKDYQATMLGFSNNATRLIFEGHVRGTGGAVAE